MKLHMTGMVRLGDEHRCGRDDLYGSVHVGETDVVDEITEHNWNSDAVRVILNGEEVASGACVVSLGCGYSEYTPLDWDVATVGECDLIERLRDLGGTTVELVITDEVAE